MIQSIFQHEQQYLDEGYGFVIGIDEAGRGPLAGPVVAAAVALRNFEFRNSNFEINSNFKNSNFEIDSKFKIQNSKLMLLIRDSKKLSEKQRGELYNFIHEHFHVGIGICDHKTIDRINILEATYLAMKKAVASLNSKIKNQNAKLQFKIQNRSNLDSVRCMILVDGNKVIPNLSMEQKAIVGGDNIVKSISAASIIAKVTRDRMMQEIHEKYPQYCFDKHKGYGTKLHMDMIRKHGACEIHRRSFAPFS